MHWFMCDYQHKQLKSLHLVYKTTKKMKKTIQKIFARSQFFGWKYKIKMYIKKIHGKWQRTEIRM